MRVLVSGDRNWRDFKYIESILDELHKNSLISVIIEGEAKGADSFARNWAISRKVSLLSFPAKWNIYGKGAGPIRNQQMIDEGHPDVVIAFHPDLESSVGTKDMVTRARKQNIPVIVLRGRDNEDNYGEI